MQITDILAVVDKGVHLVEELAPIASELGIPGAGPAAKIAAELGDIADNTLQRIQDGALAASTEDKAQLQALIAKLEQLNDMEDAQALA
jgi:hypothetical protein